MKFIIEFIKKLFNPRCRHGWIFKKIEGGDTKGIYYVYECWKCKEVKRTYIQLGN